MVSAFIVNFSRAASLLPKRFLMSSALPLQAKELSLSLKGGLTLAGKVWGQGNPSKRILALHGYLDNAATFDILAPRLAGEGYELVCLDFPGHGHSDHLGPETWYHNLDYPDAIWQAVASLGWDNFTLLGHSMGAGVSSMLAASFPERILSCIFIDGLGPFSADASRASSHLRRAIESRAQHRTALSATERHRRTRTLEEAIQARVSAAASFPSYNSISYEAAASLVKRAIVSDSNGCVTFRNDPKLRIASTRCTNSKTAD